MSRLGRKKSGIPEVDRIFDDVIEEIRDLEGQPLSGTIIIYNVTLANATATLIPHKFGRKPKTWWAGNFSAVANIYSTSRDDKFITLVASTTGDPVTFDLFLA